MKYQPTIGLEIHVELKTNSKMFCSCKNDSEEKKPNSNICPVCMGHPGTLPVINKEAIRKTIKTGLALNCRIEKNSWFERKNYFYPDLPKGYQISQYASPLGKNGFFILPKTNKKIRIRRAHLEEDTGKLIHPENTDYSLIDFNRAGIPLMELVTEPDIYSSQEAGDFIKELQLILKYLGVSGANMEKGEMRCEVNISLSSAKGKAKSEKLGTKVEIKNLNSIKAVEKSIEYEIKRQEEILERGEKVIQETRGWNDAKEITFSQREKEEAQDYRYFPEPDLPPLNLSEEFIEEINLEIPELPIQRKERFLKEYYLPEKETELYVSNKDLGEFFEKVISELKEWVASKKLKEVKEKEFKALIKLASNYISSDLQGILKESGVENINSPQFLITAENFAEFLSMLQKKEISSRIAKTLLKEMFKTGKDPSQIIEEKDLKQVSDIGEIEKIIKQVLEENKKAVQDYKKGKETALQFLAGKTMSKTKGKANPEVLQKALKKLLG